MAGAANLAELEARAFHEIRLLHPFFFRKQGWIPERKHYEPNGRDVHVWDCLIVGGGEGKSLALEMMFQRVFNVLVIDKNPDGLEGPWRTFARMNTLRSPKWLRGPDCGIPSLTFQAWYEAQFGAPAFVQLAFIPTETWALYLDWIRKIIPLQMRNFTEATDIEWMAKERMYKVTVLRTIAKTYDTIYTRKIVLATGIEAAGGWVPPPVVTSVPKKYWALSTDTIDFKALQGKRVAILGAGAAAFDNAAQSLEAGATTALMFSRRKIASRRNYFKWINFPGFIEHHRDVDDADKWKTMWEMVDMGHPPPTTSWLRCAKFDGFKVVVDGSWDAIREVPEKNCVIVSTPAGEFEVDFLITAIGFKTDLTLRPELRRMTKYISLWADNYTPPEHMRDASMSRHPYLGRHCEFQPKKGMEVEGGHVRGIFIFSVAGWVSHGVSGSSINAMTHAVPRVVRGVVSQLYKEDVGYHIKTLEWFDEEEFPPIEESRHAIGARAKPAAKL